MLLCKILHVKQEHHHGDFLQIKPTSSSKAQVIHLPKEWSTLCIYSGCSNSSPFCRLSASTNRFTSHRHHLRFMRPTIKCPCGWIVGSSHLLRRWLCRMRTSKTTSTTTMTEDCIVGDNTWHTTLGQIGRLIPAETIPWQSQYVSLLRLCGKWKPMHKHNIRSHSPVCLWQLNRSVHSLEARRETSTCLA